MRSVRVPMLEFSTSSKVWETLRLPIIADMDLNVLPAHEAGLNIVLV
jgi:hypothetical protein